MKVRALNPAMVGKFIEPSTPLASMSRTRSCTSKQPGRSSEYEPGLKPHSLLGQPTVAAMPKGVEVFWPWNSHSSTPASFRTTLGTRSRYLSGHVVVEHVGRLDHVVVDAHQDHVVHLHGGLLVAQGVGAVVRPGFGSRPSKRPAGRILR